MDGYRQYRTHVPETATGRGQPHDRGSGAGHNVHLVELSAENDATD